LSEITTVEAMSKPHANGHIHVKRVGPRGLLPSTWLDRTLRIEYTDCHGTGQETSGVLLDFFPTGPILNVGGCKDDYLVGPARSGGTGRGLRGRGVLS
jgi:hypothetical protein